MVIIKGSSGSCCRGSPETVEEALGKPLSFCLITPVIIISSAKADFKGALKFLFSGLKEKRQPESLLIWTSMWIPQNPIIPLLYQQFDQFSLFPPQGNNFSPLCVFSLQNLSTSPCTHTMPWAWLPSPLKLCKWHWLVVPMMPENEQVAVEEGNLPARTHTFTRIFFLKEEFDALRS